MLNIVKFKGCKRCGDYLFLKRDAEGLYISCLQYGTIVAKQVRYEEPAPEARRQKVLIR